MTNSTQTPQSTGVKFGKYQVFAKLAAGGMAELFLAKQEGLAGINKTVVLKCVLPHLAQSEEFLTMFLDEARVATHLQHPNIVQIYEVGQVNDIYYIAMEYIRGQDLKKIRKKLYKSEQYKENPPYGFAAGIIAQAADGLHHAHNATDEMGNPLHIIHRDVSPNNLLVSYTGNVKIVDFGVAKATTQEHRTRVGMLKGRLSYMSPEQLSGKPLAPYSDVFSLGIVLYELTTNKRLFKRRTEGETIQAVLKDPITPPSKLAKNFPPQLEQIILKALARDPEKRYQTADELRQALEQFMRETEYFGPRQIAEVMDAHFGEEKSQGTGVMQNPFNQADLQYLAYRTGSFSSFSPPGSGDYPRHPADPRDYYNALEASLSISGSHSSSSFMSRPGSGSGSLSAAHYGITGGSSYAQAPSNSGKWVITIVLLLLILAGLIYTQRDKVLVMLGGKPQEKTANIALRKKLIAKYKSKLEEYLRKSKFSKAQNYLQSIQESKDGEILKNWLDKMQKHVDIESRLVSANLFLHQKSYTDAIAILKKLLHEYPESEKVRDRLEDVELARKKQLAKEKAAKQKQKLAVKKSSRKRRYRRRRRRRRRSRRKIPPKPVEKPKPKKKGKLFLNCVPTCRVELDGDLIGYTPINGKKFPVGRYKLLLSSRGYLSDARIIEIKENKPVDLNVHLKKIAKVAPPRPRPHIIVQPRPKPPVRPVKVALAIHKTKPKPRKTKRHRPSFRGIRLPRRVSLRLSINDTRGIVGRIYTSRHRQLCRKIERELSRILGPKYDVKGVTKDWQRYVKRKALKHGIASMVFYPRAVAYVIFRNITRGRSKRRISQLLVYYQRKHKFKRYRNK